MDPESDRRGRGLRSDGHIKINCVPDGTMGGEDELIPQVFAGTLDMSLSGPSVWGTVGGIDEIGWSELPYVVTSYSEMNALGGDPPEAHQQAAWAKGISLYCLGAMSQEHPLPAHHRGPQKVEPWQTATA